jgi:hypothetical protein
VHVRKIVFQKNHQTALTLLKKISLYFRDFTGNYFQAEIIDIETEVEIETSRQADI